MRLPALIAFVGLVAGEARGQCNGECARGLSLFHARRYDDARAVLAPLAESDSASKELLFYAGRLALRARDFRSSVRLLERAVAMDAGNSVYVMWLGRAYAQDAINGNKMRLVFVARRSRNAFERAVALDPANVQARLDLGQYYLLAPGIVGGSVEKARGQVREIAKHDAFWGHVAAASVARAQKDTVTAEHELRAAVAVAPDSVTGHGALAQFLSERGRYPEAYDEVRRLMATHPEEPMPHYYMGVLAASWKQHLDEGAAALRRYMTLLPREEDPPLASAHYWLGAVYRAQEKADSARAEFREALRLNPQSSRARKALEEMK